MAQTKQKKPADTEGRTLHLVDEIHRQNRARKRRRRLELLGVLVLVVAYFSGVFHAIFTASSNLYESFTIATMSKAGVPAQTGISDLYQVEPLSGGFVALGAESCVVYSAGGNRLRSLQLGYLRPTIAAGSNRYLLYNRAGYELQVESRTKTLYTQTYTNSILLAAVSDKGTVAVLTESDRYFAALTMYSNTMEPLLEYYMTDTQGTPIRMEYSSTGETLAIATISAQGGQMYAQVHLVSPETQACVLLDATLGATPLALEWLSKTELLVVYDNFVAVYDTQTQATLASYAYNNKVFVDYAVCDGNLALLFAQGTDSEILLLDQTLTLLTSFETEHLVSSVVLDDCRIFAVYEKQIDTYSYAGDYIDTYQSEQKILRLLATDHIYIFTANETAIFTPPAIS